MREYIINDKNEGQRLDKYIFRILPKAQASLIYKSFRKKNIVLNNKKCDGKELLKNGDSIKIYMSDDTIDLFSDNKSTKSENVANNTKNYSGNNAYYSALEKAYEKMPDIIYEDEDIILVNKPAGMLSQKAKDEDISLNEICLSYMKNKKDGNLHDNNFTPSICNRLDRNTCGIILFAKNYKAARMLGQALKDRTICKYYICICKGKIENEISLNGSLIKDERNNKVSIDLNDKDGKIHTHIIPLCSNDDISILKIHLITGKTHQIRAHLASINHPIIGDYKYGNRAFNDIYKKKFGISHQMLCAYKVIMPKFTNGLDKLKDKIFEIDLPTEFMKVIKDGNLEIKRS